MKKVFTYRYFLLLIPSAFFAMLMWTTLIDGKFYYCSDKVPFLDFFPPFVHGIQVGDFYIVPENWVWVTWVFFIFGIFGIPILFTQKRKGRTSS